MPRVYFTFSTKERGEGRAEDEDFPRLLPIDPFTVVLFRFALVISIHLDPFWPPRHLRDFTYPVNIILGFRADYESSFRRDYFALSSRIRENKSSVQTYFFALPPLPTSFLEIVRDCYFEWEKI